MADACVPHALCRVRRPSMNRVVPLPPLRLLLVLRLEPNIRCPLFALVVILLCMYVAMIVVLCLSLILIGSGLVAVAHALHGSAYAVLLGTA